jgi:hypothetical protein
MVVVFSRETAGKNFARDACWRLLERWSPGSQMKIARLLHSLLKEIQQWIAVIGAVTMTGRNDVIALRCGAHLVCAMRSRTRP